MKFQLCTAVAGIALLAASGASAQSTVPVGPYVQVNLGSSVAGKTDFSATTGSFSGSQDADLDKGFFGSAAAGLTFDNSVSLEGELLYSKNDIDTADIDRVLGRKLEASVKTTAIMANAFYNIGGLGPINARVGAGVGHGRS